MAETDPPATQPAGQIRDARGRVVSQLDPVMMQLLRRHDVIPSGVLRDVAQEVGSGLTRVSRMLLWASIGGLVCFGIALVICVVRLATGNFGARDVARSMIPYMAIWSGLSTLWVVARNARHQRIGHALLRHLRCPHCGYDLRLLPTDPADGATVCPECGCAWRLDELPAAGDAQYRADNAPSPTGSQDDGGRRHG